MLNKLPRAFYARDTVTVAKELLGKYLVHGEKIARIVEVEAYLGAHDLACHSAKGVTPRTAVMYGEPGYAYVYLIYGMYYCTNVVTESAGIGSAVLLRALEPIAHVTARTQGPGLLSRAMNIDKQLNAHDLLSDNFYIAAPSVEETFTLIARPRIGVHYAQEWAQAPLRFYIQGNAFISKP
ncbi:MAG: DNA-3-methyladenine glycosylase [Legionella sp.]|nr:DNA-3-methyladenine glycosylase [Legionella sp.]